MEYLLGVLRDAGQIYGHFAKDKQDSEFAQTWTTALNESGIDHQFVDIASSFAQIFAVKLDREVEYMKKSSEASTNAWNHLKKKIISIVDINKVLFF